MTSKPTEAPRTARDALAQVLGDRADLVEVAGALFDYAQYLLDDDQRLTKSGALDGQGRELLRARALELLGGPARPEVEEEEEEDDLDDEEVDE
ncbi:MAG: hypothetical protein ACOZQL_41490 [Myxococcota bacterium]